MVHQTPLPSFSTTDAPSDPGSWSAPRNFFDAEPPIVTENKGPGGRLRTARAPRSPSSINPCRLQFPYQGMDPASSGDYSQLPWKLALLTQTDSSC